MIASTMPRTTETPKIVRGTRPCVRSHGEAEASIARSAPPTTTTNGHRALCDGPVGVPKLVIVGWLSFCTFGPGAPTTLTIRGAKTAARIRKAITPSATSATLS